MTQFLSSKQVGAAVRRVVKGANARCAVAFWGDDQDGVLFERGLPYGAKVICDVTIGGTNPRELLRLGAPDNPKLRHLPRLHAKVYLSDRGVIIGSANASKNGLGTAADGGLVEACVFHPPGDEVHQQAARWFERLWKRSLQVDDDALDDAKLSWGRRPRPGKRARKPDPASVLDTLLSDPERFRGVGVVFCGGKTSPQVRDEAAQGVIEDDHERPTASLDEIERARVANWPTGNVFSEWKSDDINAWPRTFICAHQNRLGRMNYWFYHREHTTVLEDDSGEKTRGMVLAALSKTLRKTLGFERPERELAQIDQQKLQQVMAALGEEGHRLFENVGLMADFISGIET